jgi:DNA-binding PadR family transcriptional regulator
MEVFDLSEHRPPAPAPAPGPKIRWTIPTTWVIALLAKDVGDQLYGARISQITNLDPGTVQPILARLERIGWAESRFEQVDPRAAGRPRRRYYRLTRKGRDEIKKVRLPAISWGD